MKNTVNNSLSLILNAKEKRSALKIAFADKGLNSLTVSLNIPGLTKSNSIINLFFNKVIDELKNHLEANRIILAYDQESSFVDNAGDFYIVPFNDDKNYKPELLKNITEKFEESHSLGRLVDVDIFSSRESHISSGKNKLCYYCKNHPAIYCMRNKTHSYSEMSQKIITDIETYFKNENEEKFIKTISSLASKAILYEVSLSPKPGLVDYYSSGTHKDMNYYSFLNSSSVLSTYFRDFCTAGYHFSSDWKNALPLIRKIGLNAEKSMYEATDKTNTQKGIIFIFGISLFAYSYLYANKKELSVNNFRETVKKISENIVHNELKVVSQKNKTHGEKVFMTFGEAGIRHETEKGFPTIFKTALPFLDKNFDDLFCKNQELTNKILQIGLLKIMSENNDTNILYRSNSKMLIKLKEHSKKAINNDAEYKRLCHFCLKHNLSPGGSADLLALSIFIHFVNNLKEIPHYEF